MMKHRCSNTPERVVFHGRTFEFHTCIHCGRRFGLEAWQLREMPRFMSRCCASPKRAGFWEWIRDRIDCMAPTPKETEGDETAEKTRRAVKEGE